MKKTIFLQLIAILFVNFLDAQDAIPAKHRIYKVTATTNKAGTSAFGYLASVSDSSIAISPNGISFMGYERRSNERYHKIDYYNLTQLRLRRKGSTGRGLLIGTITGAAAGAILGLVDGSDYKENTGSWCILCLTAGEKAAAGGVVFGLLGGIIGTVTGAIVHKTFIIGGRKEKFDAMKLKLLQ